ncbi:MAG: oligoendopeptidase F [Lachnospiraceae bacterium]|nr:oligoendopeptidase F [Lachnospiraceae bacterium]
MKEVLKRNEVDPKYTWAMEDMYANEELWEQEYKQLEQYLGKISAKKGKLGESADSLAEYFEMCDAAKLLIERLYVYSNQHLHEDLGNSHYQKLAARAEELMIKLDEASAFANPEILAIPEETLNQFLEDCERLQCYEITLQRLLRTKEHILSEKEEALLAAAGEVCNAPSNIFAIFNNADLKFGTITGENGEPVELTHGRYISLLESQNREVRKAVFQQMYGTYSKYKNMLGTIFAANVKQEAFRAKARKFPSSRAAALFDSHIPEKVYDNLIETIHKSLPLMHRYVALRKKMLGLDELHMYDLYVPMVSDFKMEVTYEEAKKLVKEGLAPMGEDYLNVLQEGFDNRWIDVYENQGKRSGAYSWGAYGTHPYVLLNYQDNLSNVFTLAHEMGHALHSYYSDQTQPITYAGYRIFVAEVASTCNESLLIHYLLKKASSQKEKMYLINYFLEQFRATIFRQTMFAEFEMKAHQMSADGTPLNGDNLSELYYDLNKLYFGDGLVVDEDIAMEWARIPHFYTPFYVYQYATGFSAAIALSKKIMTEGEAGVADYMKFLTGGCSKDPIDLLRLAGVDMEQPQPVEEAMQLFAELLDEMEKAANL